MMPTSRLSASMMGMWWCPPSENSGTSSIKITVGASHAHLPRHDLAHHFRLLGMAHAQAAHQPTQPLAYAFVPAKVGKAHEVRHSHDADDAARPVGHWQRLDAMLAHHGPRVGQVRSEFHGDGIGRHHVRAAQRTELALVSHRLRVVQQGFQVVAAHVQHLVVMRQRDVQVGGGESRRSLRRAAARRRLGMRVGPAGHAVVQHACEDQQHGVGENRERRELKAVGMGQHGEQGGGAARRVQAAQLEHQADGQGHCHGGGHHGIGNQQEAGNPHQRRDGVAAHHRPGLRERAGRHSEHQHGARADRRHEPGGEPAGVAQPLRQQSSHQHADGSAERAAPALVRVDEHGRGPQGVEPGKYPRAPSPSGWGKQCVGGRCGHGSCYCLWQPGAIIPGRGQRRRCRYGCS